MPPTRNSILVCATLAVFVLIPSAHAVSNNNYPYTTALSCWGNPVYTWSLTVTSTSTYHACPETSCYDYYTRNNCCMTYFNGYDGLLNQQCRCGPSVVCPTLTATTLATTAAGAATATPTPTTTTTPTNTLTPTTTAPPSLCQPALPLPKGAPVNNDCAFAGVSNITISSSGTKVMCNAVLATVTVDGTPKKTFLTPSACKKLIDGANGVVYISIGAQNFPVQKPIFTMSDGTNGNALITIDPLYISLLYNLGSCQKTACTYNRATMGSKVNLTDCKLISWGAEDDTSSKKGEYETPVEMNIGGCDPLLIPNESGAQNTVCFTTTTGQNTFCSGDSGAPLYCRAHTNGEWILMGVAAYQTKCNPSPDFKVIPFPVDFKVTPPPVEAEVAMSPG
ncbi:unnamed protein product [Lymnaea stagnalis]|uniref:Peptidase S1 domain-containing protein n=1 Tax=Lymnaea stagnalis TaxID=6523 RepID=A0AAV2HKH1_LYMST